MVNPNPGLSLLDPYIKITLGNLGSQSGDTFTIGDGKLINASVTLGEGKVQSSCSFTVLDPDKKLADKYFSYIESVDGLDPIPEPEEQSNNNIAPITEPDQTNITAGKVIFENVEASTYGYGEPTQGGDTGSYGDKIDWNGMYAAMVDTKYKYAIMRVTNLANNKSIKVKVVDRGPFAVDSNGRAIRPLREHPTRKIDLVPAAWKALTNNATPGIINVKIEWLEKETTTASTSNRNKTVQEIVQEESQKNKKQQASNNPFKAEKIGDWPLPKVGPTKSILITSGHRIDISGGTNGTSSSSVTYAGETRTVESVATEIAAQLLRGMLIKAGYTVITPPDIGTARGDAARKAYQDKVAALKEQTGAYALELHFDEPAGRPGVIAGAKYDTSGKSLSVMDVVLAKEFGHFPFNHRDDLGAPTRGITILEISPLNTLLTNLTINGVNNDNFAPLRDALSPFMERVVKALNTVASVSPASKAAESTSTNPTKEAVPTPATLAGSQITVEMGYGGKTIAAYSFVHTALRFSLFEPNALEFTGQAASWVLTQRVKNTVYQNMSFKKIAQRITSAYGMKLDMLEEGPTYTYFPQRGQTDYEALLIEARRIGYRVHTKGATLSIQPRKGVTADKEIFVLEYGSNMGTSFEVIHQAQKDSEGGARSSVPGANNSTGERKYEIDPDTGQVVQKRKENVIGTGRDAAIATTGSPIKAPAPKTTGTTDKQDSDRKANEDRIKGILASAEFPTTPEALTLDPDTPFLTKGVSTVLDRMWVVDSVSHDYSTGSFTTKVSCYSPLKNKSGSADITSNTVNNSVTGSNPTGYIIPAKGTFTSPYGMRTHPISGQRKMHNGIDIANASGTPIYAAAVGTVSFASNASDGYGNKIIINHANNEQTLYGHLQSISVQVNQEVKQGQLIGLMGSTGFSTGPHLHWEIKVNGTAINPASRVSLPSVGGKI